jgi:adenine/guanine/hypoxanthine permease
MDKLGQVGVLYRGLEVLGGGAILSGLVLGAIGAFLFGCARLPALAFPGRSAAPAGVPAE